MKDRVGGNWPGLDGRLQYLPAAIVLLGVSVFWFVGILGGLRVLYSPAPALSMLIWLYIMLAAVGLSVIAAALAMLDIAVRHRRRSRLAAQGQQTEGTAGARPYFSAAGSAAVRLAARQKPVVEPEKAQASASEREKVQTPAPEPAKARQSTAVPQMVQAPRAKSVKVPKSGPEPEPRSMQDSGRRIS